MSGEYDSMSADELRVRMRDCLEVANARSREIVRLCGEVEKLREDRDEYRALFDLQQPLLRGTANALKGEPEPQHMHDLSDLPRVAAAVVRERDDLLEARRVEAGKRGEEGFEDEHAFQAFRRRAWKLEDERDELQAELDALRARNRRLETMVGNLRRHGRNAIAVGRQVLADRTRLFGPNVHGDELMQLATAVHYVSTYCIHGLHETCRNRCMHCQKPCRCDCHNSSEVTSDG